MDTNETITISLKEYKRLIESQKMLSALRCGGVDSWEGYEEAVNFVEEESEDE